MLLKFCGTITFFRLLKQSVIIANLIPVRKVPYQNVYLKQHNSTDSEAVKFLLLQNDTFYNDDIQQDSYYGSNNNSTGFSPYDVLFSFMSEKYIVCYVCGLRSLHLSPVVYITPTYTSSMRELMMQGIQRNDKVLLSMLKVHLACMSNLTIFSSLQFEYHC